MLAAITARAAVAVACRRCCYAMIAITIHGGFRYDAPFAKITLRHCYYIRRRAAVAYADRHCRCRFRFDARRLFR